MGPAHMIIPRKFKKEDNGTYDKPRNCPIIPRKLKREDTSSYDNTAEVSEKTTTISHIMDHKDRIRTSNDVTCFHPMDNKYCCSTTCSHIMVTNNHKLEETFSPFKC